MKLSALVSNILSPAPGSAPVAELAHLFHRMATAYLRGKSNAGNLNPNILGIPIEDIAWDCIAELFRRDERGCFTQLSNYYQTFDQKNMSEEELLGMSRRLVFSKVNHELYRQYKEEDPSLHKVLRNLKDAVLKVQGVSLETINNHLCLVFEDERSPLPVMPPEILESYLTGIVRTETEQPAILAQTVVLFIEQSRYCRSYPLAAFGRALRSAINRVGGDIPDRTESGEQISGEELRSFIAASAAQVKESVRRKYVDSEKLSAELFDLYFMAVQGVIETEFVSGDGNDTSYYEHLVTHLVAVTQEDYRLHHRTRMEYFVKLTRRHFLETVRREL